MAKIKVGINGLGRIGRAFVKVASERPEIELVAANDLGDINNLAYLLKYDSAYGRSNLDIKVNGDNLIINDQIIKFIQEKDPSKLPWGELGVDVVVESTGLFEDYAKAKAHLDAGARKVVISAPAKGTPPEGVIGEMVLMSINDDKLSACQISSNASCTTNCASPVVSILNETIGIEKAMLSTIHAYTATQKLVDGPDAKDWRRGRAGAANIVPSTTGAATALAEVMPELKGKFDGIALRVPVITGSLTDITFIAKRNTTVEEVNDILRKAATEPRWNKIFSASDEELVSSDIINDPHASIADLKFTKVVDGNLVKVLAWYDNEMGYTHTLVEHVIKTGSN
jgi:glyceraldehyde 3-phosphate dehydrogenase